MVATSRILKTVFAIVTSRIALARRTIPTGSRASKEYATGSRASKEDDAQAVRAQAVSAQAASAHEANKKQMSLVSLLDTASGDHDASKVGKAGEDTEVGEDSKVGEGRKKLKSRGDRELDGDFFKGEAWKVVIVQNVTDFCGKKPSQCVEGVLKPQRSDPHMTLADLMSALEDEAISENPVPGTFPPVLKGPINGWSGMTNVQLQELKCTVAGRWFSSESNFYFWDMNEKSVLPSTAGFEKENFPFQAAFFEKMEKNCKEPFSLSGKIVAKDWSTKGWTKDAVGFVMHYRGASSQEEDPKWYLGKGIQEDQSKKGGQQDLRKEESYQTGEEWKMHVVQSAHIFAHKYVKTQRGLKDFFTWHTGLFLEWRDRDYGSVVELAWLNGLGGYKGKSSYYKGSLVMPSEMVLPWDATRSEIRVLDVNFSNIHEFKKYLKESTGSFMTPEIHESAVDLDVHRPNMTRQQLGMFLAQYILADGSYSEKNRNCQTFTVELFFFLTGIEVSTRTGFEWLPGVFGGGFKRKSPAESFLKGIDGAESFRDPPNWW